MIDVVINEPEGLFQECKQTECVSFLDELWKCWQLNESVMSTARWRERSGASTFRVPLLIPSIVTCCQRATAHTLPSLSRQSCCEMRVNGWVFLAVLLTLYMSPSTYDDTDTRKQPKKCRCLQDEFLSVCECVFSARSGRTPLVIVWKSSAPPPSYHIVEPRLVCCRQC